MAITTSVVAMFDYYHGAYGIEYAHCGDCGEKICQTSNTQYYLNKVAAHVC